MSGFVFVCEDEASKHEGVELPAEGDGKLLLSVVQSQFEGALGLRYRNPTTGLWRAVKIVEGVLHPPEEGWGETPYVVVKKSEPPIQEPVEPVHHTGDGYKRKMEDPESERAAKNPRSSSPDFSKMEVQDLNREDLIILGLEYSVNDAELKRYFEQFGEVAEAEVKKDMNTGRSRGFGFVRYFDPEIQRKVQAMKHTIKNRRVDVKYPKKSSSYVPCKLFVGCLPLKPEVTREELEEYFGQFGEITDVYIPKPYRGFGFVAYQDGGTAQRVVEMTHTLRKSTLNLSLAEPKGTRQVPNFPFSANYYQQWYNPQQAGYATAQGGTYTFGSTQPSFGFGRGFTPQGSQNFARGAQAGSTFQARYQASPRARAPPPPASNTAPQGQFAAQGGYQESGGGGTQGSYAGEGFQFAGAGSGYGGQGQASQHRE